MAVQYYVASSLDGFIADAEDGLGWLDAQPAITEDTYAPFIAGVGALCMGSATYAFLLRHLEDGTMDAWPYAQPCWVFTTRDLPVPPGADVRFAQGDVAPVHAEMQAAAGEKDLWIVGGGELAARFLDAGLLDELIVTVASCTLGAGKPLLPRRCMLRLTGARPLGEGFVELRYAPETGRPRST